MNVDKEPFIHHTAPLYAAPPPPPPQPLTNEDLLKSIDFIPGGSISRDHVPEPPIPSEPSAPLLSDILPEDVPQPLSCSGSSDDLVKTFEMVETPEMSVISLASNDSLYQPPPEQTEGEERFYDLCS